jgi:anti-anti-sigma factor
MTSAICNTIDTVIFFKVRTTELVRGQEQDLIQEVLPLVRQHNVVLDLGNVLRIDAAGIAALISLYGTARDARHSLTVANASARVAEILALVGVDRVLLSQNAVKKSHPDNCYEESAA